MDHKKALRRYRAKMGYTVEEAARRCGVVPRTYQRWESDRPELNHGELKLFPVPVWLRHYVARNRPLPEPPE
jgi:transcriptional regulator with XRE-family HTH domain